MVTTGVQGYCLVSQQLRQAIIDKRILVPERDFTTSPNGYFKDSKLEDRIQPSSMDVSLGSEAYILSQSQSAFKPRSNTSVWSELLKLPHSQRQRVSLDEKGFEAKAGFTYLIPLQESVVLGPNEQLRFSPKSSTGRLFPRSRVLIDRALKYDRVRGDENKDARNLWLMLQPRPFNLIITPGLTLAQVRFFQGDNISLSESELREENKHHPLLWDKTLEGGSKPLSVEIGDDGLQLELDFSGKHTRGIAGLRALKTHDPIDLREKGTYDPKVFFEPVVPVDGKVRLVPGEHYLFSSRGQLNIPSRLSCELRRHAGVGIRGDWDEAGFVDPGFQGDLVAEVVINEHTPVDISTEDHLPVSALEFFRTALEPDKIYGSKIGSTYDGQVGARVSKHFRPFDFRAAAKEYKKLEREVLVIDPRITKPYRSGGVGFERIDEQQASELILRIQERGFFQSRWDCEEDPQLWQVIPYGLLLQGDSVFSYVRAANIQDYGDERLFNKMSIGIGGHIDHRDKPNLITGGIEREFREEITVEGTISKPRIIGTLFTDEKPVDRVHFGLIYACRVNGDIKSRDPAVSLPKMMPFSHVMNNIDKLETWSKLLVPYLSDIAKQVQ